MDESTWPEDPVIEEIRAIREENARRTEGFTDEERLKWYKTEARKARSRMTTTQETTPLKDRQSLT